MSTFDDIIKQKADGHQAPVPPDAWDNIVQKKRKRRFGFFWWTAAILLLCGLGTAWYFNMQPAAKNNGIAINETAIKNAPIKIEKAVNQKLPVTAQRTDSATTKTVTNNSEVLSQKTLSEAALNATIKTKTSQQQVTEVLNNKVTAYRQDGIVAEGNEKKTILKEKQPSSLAANGKQVKKVKGKATFQVKGVATEEENESAQNKKTAASIKVKTTETANDKNDLQAIGITSNEKGKGIVVKASKALSFGEGLGEVTPKGTISNNNADDKPIKKQQAILPAELISAKDHADTLDKKQTLTKVPTENKKQPASNQKQSKKKHWFADIAATPVLPIQQYSQPASFVRTASSANSRSVFSGKLISTSIDPAVAFSLAVRKGISTKTSIGIGLQYLQLKEHLDLSGTETHTDYSIVNRLINTSNGPALINDTVQTVTEGKRQIAATNNYTFYSIPIFIQYNFIQKSSWSAGIAGGLFVNIFSQYKNEINQNGSAFLTPTSQTNSTNSMGLDVYAGLRFGKMLGRKVEFFALPSMRWNLKEQGIKNSLMNKKIQQAGVSFGLSIQLK